MDTDDGSKCCGYGGVGKACQGISERAEESKAEPTEPCVVEEVVTAGTFEGNSTGFHCLSFLTDSKASLHVDTGSGRGSTGGSEATWKLMRSTLGELLGLRLLRGEKDFICR